MKYLVFIYAVFLLGFTPEEQVEKPNVIVIYVDELRWDALGITGHPYVETPNIDRIAEEGMLMKNAFVVSPICGPSRSNLLTGSYFRYTGAYKNTTPRGFTQTLITYPLLMQYAGYKNAMIGKYDTGRNADKSPGPGFDRWFITGVNRDYKMDPIVNVDGVPTQYTGHATDIESDEAVRFIRENKDEPFTISLWHRSVHTSYGEEGLLAAERNRNLYKDVPIVRAKSADSLNVIKSREGKPVLENTQWHSYSDEDLRNISRMLVDIDDGVGNIFKALEEEGILDKTMIIFLGDNGFFFGEHGLTEKRLAYEESIRVPFLVRYPPLIEAGTVSDIPILNIDIAPTILELAELPILETIHGHSLLPVFEGGELENSRSSLMFEFLPETRGSGGGTPPYVAVRTNEWKYIHYTDPDMINSDVLYDELYNLIEDPMEINNLIHNEKYSHDLEFMKNELKKNIERYGEGVLFQILYSIDGTDLDTDGLPGEVYYDDDNWGRGNHRNLY